MGPYCKYCGQRCFVPFPQNTPEYILNSYRPGVSIIATCPGGQKFEKEKTGYCYDEIKAKVAELEQQASIGVAPGNHEEYEQNLKQLASK
jgi:hypothetical protein